MGKNIIKIKSWIIKGEVIFSYECEDNTIKKTVEEAVRQKVDLAFADLSGAILSGANLSGADLSYAKLRSAVLTLANLSHADLSHADLRQAVLAATNLSHTDLGDADLYGAILSITNLLGANLYGAGLSHTDLSDSKIDYPMDILDGELIGWKKVHDFKQDSTVIIKLKILEDSKRSRATTNKYRCNKALVLEIQNLDGSKSELTKVVNTKYKTCTYQVGKIARADKWDENRFNECSHGIHFFLDRERAVEYDV